MPRKDKNKRKLRAKKVITQHSIIKSSIRKQSQKNNLHDEHQQLLSIFDSTDQLTYVVDPDSYEVLYLNQAGKDIFGDVVGKKCYQALQHNSKPCSFCTNKYIFGKNLGKSYIWEFKNHISNRWYHCIDKAIKWPDGRMVRYEMAVDIQEKKLAEEIFKERYDALAKKISRQTIGLEELVQKRTAELAKMNYELQSEIADRKIAEKALLESEERYRRVVELSPDAIIVHSKGKIVFINHSGLQIIGAQKEEEMIGRNILDFVHPDYREVVMERAQKMYKAEVVSPLIEEKFIRLDGSIIDVEVAAAGFHFQNEPAVLVVVRDITERKKDENLILHLAYHDSVTGLPNRILFHDRIELAMAQAKRYQQKLAVMFLDLDKFKHINDTLGHTVGDQLLKEIGSRLTNLLRKMDTIARMGGDEFMILLAEINNENDVIEIVNKIMQSFQEVFQINGHTINITTSIGVVLYPEHGEDAETLIQNADIAMYHSKDLGRNRYCVFTEELRLTA